MNVGFAVELALILLLLATCAYCFILTRRLKALREGQEGLAAAIAKFDEATQRAEKNLAVMEREGLSVNRDLGAVMRKAGELNGELSVMVSAGDRIAARIETAMQEIRSLGRRAALEDKP